MRNSNYEINEIIQNVIYVMKSRISFPGSRMIRFPIIIRGKKYIDFGKNLTTGRNCRFEVNGIHSGNRLVFGNNVNIGDNVSIRCANQILIGNNVLMGSKVLIIDNSHGTYSGDNQDCPDIPPNERELSSAQIEIGDNVWVGEGAVIQQGVCIGRGSIIAANSVVTKDVPINSMVAGVPAKVIKVYDESVKEWRRSR